MTYLLEKFILENFVDDTNINLSIHNKHTKKLIINLVSQILACLKIT